MQMQLSSIYNTTLGQKRVEEKEEEEEAEEDIQVFPLHLSAQAKLDTCPKTQKKKRWMWCSWVGRRGAYWIAIGSRWRHWRRRFIAGVNVCCKALPDCNPTTENTFNARCSTHCASAGSYTWEKFGFLGACECEIALLLCLLCILKQQSEPLPSNEGKHWGRIGEAKPVWLLLTKCTTWLISRV